MRNQVNAMQKEAVMLTRHLTKLVMQLTGASDEELNVFDNYTETVEVNTQGIPPPFFFPISRTTRKLPFKIKETKHKKTIGYFEHFLYMFKFDKLSLILINTIWVIWISMSTFKFSNSYT